MFVIEIPIKKDGPDILHERKLTNVHGVNALNWPL